MRHAPGSTPCWLASCFLLALLTACGTDEPAGNEPGTGDPPVAKAPPPAADAVKESPERPARPRDATHQAVAQLVFEVDGEVRSVEASLFEKLAGISVQDDPGEESREGWDARDLVKAVAGDAARLVRVRDQDDVVTDVPADAWGDASRRPVLRLNRRGLFKLSWATSGGDHAEGPVVRGVKELVIATR